MIMIIIIKLDISLNFVIFQKFYQGYKMRTLFNLKKDEVSIIKKITATGDLRERFISFGITKGSEITLKNCSANRENLEINIDDVYVALRKNEAEKIEVE